MANTTEEEKNSSDGVDLQVEMAYEILSRLPVKSLMRFKCVSKHWLSIIKDDNYFIDLYHSRSKLRPCLVLFVPIYIKPNIPKDSFIMCIHPRPNQDNLLIADLCEGVGRVGTRDTKVAHNVRKTTSIEFDKVIEKETLCYDGILKPVNEYGVCIYNIGTRELTPWISTGLRSYGVNVNPKYQFGFDPATKKHKVICLWKLRRWPRRDSHRVYVGCNILTLGDNTWRTINIHEVPHYDLVDDSYSRPYGSVYVNGSIYWIACQLASKRHCGEKVIVAFDVGSEKFRTIVVPKFITNQILDDTEYTSSNFSEDLLEVNNCVALYTRLPGGYIVKLWILDCDDNHKKDVSTNCNQHWTETTIELPFQWDNKRKVVFHGIPGTDEIIIETYEDSRSINGIAVVSYSWKSMTFREVESDELNHLNSPIEFSERSVYMCSTINQSLFPLQRKSAQEKEKAS
ncbi:hypothetical protein MKW98_024169 [Papaver atlanticum]|uniref:F-box domain-containing protein n=1 Tax=Papaver atlanticum TaxID=357466 RepID=A0AAD4XNE2_9MAGN|nr:hypothetical protein MKW98_024169 [Papaver atlanticum]